MGYVIAISRNRLQLLDHPFFRKAAIIRILIHL